MKDHDPVNSPSHYTAYKGLEVIDLTEQMNFNRGNAVKYIARAGIKTQGPGEIEDLRKAAWYIQREIERVLTVHPEGQVDLIQKKIKRDPVVENLPPNCPNDEVSEHGRSTSSSEESSSELEGWEYIVGWGWKWKE